MVFDLLSSSKSDEDVQNSLLEFLGFELVEFVMEVVQIAKVLSTLLNGMTTRNKRLTITGV